MGDEEGERLAFSAYSFEGLLTWFKQNVNDDLSLDDYKEFSSAMTEKAHEFFKLKDLDELLKFYGEMREQDLIWAGWLDEWTDAILKTYPFNDIVKRIELLEKSMEVLIAEIGDMPAKAITLKERIEQQGGFTSTENGLCF